MFYSLQIFFYFYVCIPRVIQYNIYLNCIPRVIQNAIRYLNDNIDACVLQYIISTCSLLIFIVVDRW
jgi:hypothetical protein